MKRRFVGVLLACCLPLSGCASLLDREYSIVEEHSKKYWESGPGDTLRAENYQDVVNDILLLVGEHSETATLRLYDEENEMAVADVLERAAAEVQQETPLGAYAVEYITTETQTQRGYEEVTVRIGYRRTEAQIKSIVNATSTAALPDLLDAALEAEKTELAVRIGYWSEGSAEYVETAVAAARERWELTKETPWLVEYYPSNGDVGLIEFRMDVDPSELPPEEETPGEGDQSGAPAGGETAGGSGETSENGAEIQPVTGDEKDLEAGAESKDPVAPAAAPSLS